jgi:hypothetical protein
LSRFIYHASGLALGGRLTRPAKHVIEAQAACALPSTGGRARAVAPAYSLTLEGEFILSFDSAETTVEGEEISDGTHRTTVISTIRGLNVQNVLKADEVTASLTQHYDLKTGRRVLDTINSKFVNLTIDDEPWEVTFDHGLGREASDYDTFKRNHPQYEEGNHRIVHSLARHERLKFEGPDDYGYHHRPGFGRIYFGEWMASHNTQGFTMMRLNLGSPSEGRVSVGSGTGNGQSVPPTG